MKLRYLGQRDYESTWRDMQSFTDQRDATTSDELWLCEHPPVFTQGLAGRPEHLLRDIGIPIIQTDRGGQVTYHGPGQIIAYLLLDIKRRGLTVKRLVTGMEQAVILLLAEYGVSAHRKAGAPGVYVNEAKIAALGLKIKRSGCYHGLAVNVAMDLSPFSAIRPCGQEGLAITQLSAHCNETNGMNVGYRLADHLKQCL